MAQILVLPNNFQKLQLPIKNGNGSINIKRQSNPPEHACMFLGIEPKRKLRAALGVSRSKLPLREDLHLCLALRAHRSLQLRLQPNREGNKKQTADAICFSLAPPAGLEPKRKLRAALGVSRSKLPLREDLHLCLALRAHRSLQLRLQPNREGNKKQTADAICFSLAPPAGLEPATT